MPILSNAKHELFAQGVAKGLSADGAYQNAGYAPHRSSASRLLTNANVVARISEIQSKVADRAEWSAAERLKMLGEIAQANSAEDPRVSVSAIAEANKMQGSHAPTNHRHSGPGGGAIPTVDLTNVSDDELAALETVLGPLAVAASGDADAGEAGTG